MWPSRDLILASFVITFTSQIIEYTVIIFCIIFYYKLFISKNYWHKLKCYPFTPFSKNLWHTEKKDIEHVHSPSISLTAMTRSFLSANWKARLWPSVKAMLLNCIRNSAAILSVSCGSKLALYKRENVINEQEEVLYIVLQINKKMNFIKKFTYIHVSIFADKLCMPIICKHHNMSEFDETYVTESPIIDIYNIS